VHIGLDFRHHHAQADAEAAGRVIVAIMKRTDTNNADHLLQKLGVVFESF
jgi:hypothetical protein